MPPANFRLYVVTDRNQTGGRPLVPLIQEAAVAGVPVVQVRERDLATRELLSLLGALQTVSRPCRPRLLVNDRVDLALAAGLDGVHLRDTSLPVEVARRLLGPDQWVAVSTHSVDDVRRAADGGADFVVFGPVYDTSSKRAYGEPQGLRALEHAAQAVTLPVFAIGGITVDRVAAVRRAGAHGVAVISAILSSPDVGAATRAFLDALARPV